jgi:hypothetical protein
LAAFFRRQGAGDAAVKTSTPVAIREIESTAAALERSANVGVGNVNEAIAVTNRDAQKSRDATVGRNDGYPSKISDARLAAARGLTVEEMTNPSKNYGYTVEDQKFLAEQGISPAPARAAERILCAKGVDC